MDAEFREWVVGKIKETKGDDKRDFLSMLKFEPKLTAALIKSQLEVWAIQFVLETNKIMAITDVEKTVEELIKRCKREFSRELEAMK